MNKYATEYEKDLNEMKEQILKEGNTLLTKRDLLERFCKIDKEYKGRPWNLLQILANINILIGEEPCEDAISRTQALSDYADWYGYGYRDNAFYKLLKDMPPVIPKTECSCEQIKWERDMAIEQLKELGYGLGEKPRTGHWIEIAQYSDGKHKIECSECKGLIFSRGHANSFVVKNEYKFCPHCGVRMVEPQKSEG
jgi:hypothetical protein